MQRKLAIERFLTGCLMIIEVGLYWWISGVGFMKLSNLRCLRAAVIFEHFIRTYFEIALLEGYFPRLANIAYFTCLEMIVLLKIANQ
jgi:hypothetical protein